MFDKQNKDNQLQAELPILSVSRRILLVSKGMPAEGFSAVEVQGVHTKGKQKTIGETPNAFGDIKIPIESYSNQQHIHHEIKGDVGLLGELPSGSASSTQLAK
uniref:Uncharacterized protein n=1 Tax=Solanum tuberosum TaxID=4113 RepID=M1DBP1_SOLTU